MSGLLTPQQQVAERQSPVFVPFKSPAAVDNSLAKQVIGTLETAGTAVAAKVPVQTATKAPTPLPLQNATDTSAASSPVKKRKPNSILYEPEDVLGG